MKTKTYTSGGLTAAGLLALSLVSAPGAHPLSNPGYMQVNLVSDLATNAPHVDPRLVNPWGIVAGPESVWVNDNGAGLTTSYAELGHAFDFAIHIPAPGGGPGAPSGLVFNETRQFVISNATKHAASTFLMATEDGTITAWNQTITRSNAVIVAAISNAVYKGLAIADDTNGTPQLYAANFHAGTVDVFDSQFHYLTSFTDADVPALFAPFNILNVRGKLFVAFAKQRLPDMHDDLSGPGNGFIDVFDTDGTLLRRFAAQGPLNSPWGMAVAPRNFGKFSDALLVGNFGDGRINAYDLLTGKWLGPLTDLNGVPLFISGLWGLAFDREPVFEQECNFQAERLYFTAGLNGEADGLLGFIRPAQTAFPHAH